MTRYFFVVLVMALIGIAIVVKAGITMFAERQYWQDVADRFVKENVTVKPNRGRSFRKREQAITHQPGKYHLVRREINGKFPARISYLHGLHVRRKRRKEKKERSGITRFDADSQP